MPKIETELSHITNKFQSGLVRDNGSSPPILSELQPSEGGTIWTMISVYTLYLFDLFLSTTFIYKIYTWIKVGRDRDGIL